MGEYLIDVAAADQNIQVSTDGSVWANYLLSPPNITPYSTASLIRGQQANTALFTAISNMATSDVLLNGVKVKVSPEEAANKVLRGIPDLHKRNTARLQEMVKGFFTWHATKHQEFRRVFMLSVKLASSVGDEGRGVLSKSGAISALGGINPQVVRQQEAAIFGQLPSVMAPVRCGPQHLTWMHERMRLRGLSVPELPHTGGEPGAFNRQGFEPILINKVADADATLASFMDRIAKGLAPKLRKTRLGQYLQRYRSARWGQSLSVHSQRTRDANFPDGVPSYQTFVAVGAWPEKEELTLNTFTYFVDQDIKLDADFALRIVPSQDAISRKHDKEFSKTNETEAESNAHDEWDAETYSDRNSELHRKRGGVKDESGPRGLLVSAIFVFADPNPDHLKQGVTAAIAKFNDEDFGLNIAPGGQYELLEQMLPGSSISPYVMDLVGTTTARKLGACIPVRRTEIGDGVGIPWAINTQNALGQIVYEDVFRGSERGNASKTITGRPGSGKTHLEKYEMGWLDALLLPFSAVDQDADGELQVFVSQLADTQVVPVLHPTSLLCPLKVFADDPDRGQEVWLEIMQGLLGLQADSPEMTLARQITDPYQRRAMHVHSSRDVLRYLRAGHAGASAAAASLEERLDYWAGQSFTAALFDRVGPDGNVEGLPAWAPRSKSVVWRTSGLQPHKGEAAEKIPPRQRYATVMFTLVAHLSSYHLSQYRDEPGGFYFDEMKFLEGTTALNSMVETADRQGRKKRQRVIAASQTAREFRAPQYQVIARKVVMAQATRENALEAFAYSDIPATDKVVEKMLSDTSPMDPNNANLPEVGREGEGWFNDGFGGIARIKALPMLLERLQKYGTTKPSERILASDLHGADHAMTKVG